MLARPKVQASVVWRVCWRVYCHIKAQHNIISGNREGRESDRQRNERKRECDQVASVVVLMHVCMRLRVLVDDGVNVM